jgi:hypothetical protein
VRCACERRFAFGRDRIGEQDSFFDGQSDQTSL